MRHWLMKSEPDAFSWDDLVRTGAQGEPWDGVRNYQARNFMRDEMQVGDRVLFYHSNCQPPHVAGVAEVCHPAEPDLAAFDAESPYHDPKSTPQNPRWVCVRVRAVEALPAVVPLDAIRRNERLADMLLVRKGQRLSIQPVDPEHFDEILRMARELAED